MSSQEASRIQGKAASSPTFMATSEVRAEDDPPFFDTLEYLPGFEAVLTNAAPRPRPVRQFRRQGLLPDAQVGHITHTAADSHSSYASQSRKSSYAQGNPAHYVVAESNSVRDQQTSCEHDVRSCCKVVRLNEASSVTQHFADCQRPNQPRSREVHVPVEAESLEVLRRQGPEDFCSASQLERSQGSCEKAPRSPTGSAMNDGQNGDVREAIQYNGYLLGKSADSSLVEPSDCDERNSRVLTAVGSANTEVAVDADVDLRTITRPAYIPRKYSVVHDALYAERAPETEISIMKVATEVISSVKRGADVTNVNLPASVLDPVSSLEKGIKSMQRGGLIPSICNLPEPVDRFLGVLRFYFSGLSKERFGKKPYNPILGEVFRSCFVHENGNGCTVLIAEQVSHHPPITALHLCNETLGFKMNSFTAPEPRFWGNSVEVKLRGMNRITLEKWDDEEYELTRPSIHMSGFLAGRHHLEFIGTTSVTCAKTDLSAEIEFKSKGMLGRGDLNGILGRVYTSSTGKTLYSVSGTWDGILTAKNAITAEERILFDYNHIAAEHSMIAILPPHEEREETFSSSVWQECSEAIWKADSLSANLAKRKVEDTARKLRKERAAQGIAWSHIYFQPRNDGKEGYVLREGLRSMLGPDVELSEGDQMVMEELRQAVASRVGDFKKDKGARLDEHKSEKGALRLGRSKKL